MLLKQMRMKCLGGTRILLLLLLMLLLLLLLLQKHMLLLLLLLLHGKLLRLRMHERGLNRHSRCVG